MQGTSYVRYKRRAKITIIFKKKNKLVNNIDDQFFMAIVCGVWCADPGHFFSVIVEFELRMQIPGQMELRVEFYFVVYTLHTSM